MKSNAEKIRTSLHRTINQAAVYAGLSIRSVRCIERGEPQVQVRTILNLAYSYGVSPLDLLPGLGVSPGREMRFDHEVKAKKARKLG